MSFLAPLWLALSAAASIPIILHLLKRRRGVQVEFPAVRFLLRAEREHRRELRLRNLALMVLRVLIVFCIALAAARPLGRTGGAGHAPTALAVVVDNSLSTSALRGATSALETLQRAASDILGAATADDRVWLLTVDGNVAAGDAAAARAVLDRLRPIGGAGDLVGAVERGVALTRASGLNAAAVVVLTDGQASQWTRAAQVGDAPTTIVAVTTPPPVNHAVREAQPEPTRWAPRGTVRVAVTTPDSADVRVALDEKTLARTTIGRDGEMLVRGMADRRGWLAGRVELAPDELRADDARHFAIFAGDAPRVRIDQSAGAFARTALETLADGERIQLGGSIAITGAEQITARPVLAFAPSDPVRVGAANRALASAGIPWRFREIVRDETGVRGGELDGVRVHARYPFVASGAAIVDTLAVAGGSPWVVAGEGYVLVGSPLDPAATNLPVAAQFVPWLESLLARYLLTDGGRVVSVAPLADVTLPLGVDELVGAGQSSLPVHARTIPAPAQGGVYWMRRAGAVIGALVVNSEASESDLAPLDAAALEQRVAGTTVHVVAPTEDVARAAFSSSSRRPLAGILLTLLIILLIAETLVARDTHRSLT
ncbi:MAG TPA: BatA and WFA domain-containing protein [Gemmatimonadaceae bacterium]|nr:BatA and WFA domain-containing protein [Gemmatimonadaceae bacterium]